MVQFRRVELYLRMIVLLCHDEVSRPCDRYCLWEVQVPAGPGGMMGGEWHMVTCFVNRLIQGSAPTCRHRR